VLKGNNVAMNAFCIGSSVYFLEESYMRANSGVLV